MSVLVTGAGLIGCHTAGLLLAAGLDVVLLDNHPNDAAIASLLPGARIPVVQADICDAAALDRVIADHRVDRVLHAAAMLSLAFNADPPAGVAVNVLVTVLHHGRLLDVPSRRECADRRGLPAPRRDRPAPQPVCRQQAVGRVLHPSLR